MPAIYQGDKKIVDRYVGEKLITRAYQGDKLIFDAYSELSGVLPLYVRSRTSQVLKNYIIYGMASGAGVETENLWDGEFEQGTIITGSGTPYSSSYRIRSADFFYLDSGTYTFSASGVISGLVFVYDATTGQNYHNEELPYWTDLPLTFTVTSNRKIKIVCRISDSDDVYPSDITNIMLTPGSTAPSSYIPPGYKLPITVTSNGTTTDYPVYIGDSQLGEEEYVDFESGKVYKRTGNLCPMSFSHSGVVNDNGQIDTLSERLWTAMIPVESNADYVLSITGTASNGQRLVFNRVVNYDVNQNFINRTALGSLDYLKTITTESNVAYIVLDIRTLSNNVNIQFEDVDTISVTKGPTPPESYIPYLQPTDPPVPLPDITIPKGEVTIDAAEEFKYNTSIKGRINPIHYAYSINPDTAEITYLADNKNFTSAAMGDTAFDYGSWTNAFFMPRPCMLKSNGKVDYYLDPNDYSKKLDGTASDIADPTYDGNVMLEFPKIWYKFVPTGDDGESGTFHCSNVKLDDSYECWCNYDANNNEIDHFYVAAYNAVILDSKMRSLSGYDLTQENGADTTTGATEIAAARANNQNGIDEWYTCLIADHQLLTHLATLMCKHVNHQAKFGRGIDSGSIAAKRAYVTGTLNDKGLFWGDTSTGTQAVKIFGIENFYACVWKRMAGLIGTSTGYAYKLTHGTKDGSTATSFNTTGSGYKTLARTKPANGWVTTMHHESNGFWIPATIGTNRFNDYHYNGNGYVLVGGSSGSGSYCGSWCVRLADGVSGSGWNISSALSCKPKA